MCPGIFSLLFLLRNAHNQDISLLVHCADWTVPKLAGNVMSRESHHQGNKADLEFLLQQAVHG